MGFDRRENAKTYTPQDGDTLKIIAERETASGNPITWQELARFNWGTDDEVEVNAFLRDELGARKRDAKNNFVLSADDETRGQLLIPMRFERRGLAPGKTYTIRIRRKTAPPQFLECCHFPGVTFAFNSSFVRPGVVPYLKKLEAAVDRHPQSKIMIFGHTDGVGDDLYNKKLSERRAWSVFAFITNDPDAWEVLYNHPDEAWGIPVVRELLADLGHDTSGENHWGPSLKAAARSFLGLPSDAPVENNEAFRRQLFASYMAGKHEIDLPIDRFMDPAYMGCGEFNPLAGIDVTPESSRRVTFFLFDPERLPHLPCTFADVGPCIKQMISPDQRFVPTFRCSFFDSLARHCAPETPPPEYHVWIFHPHGILFESDREVMLPRLDAEAPSINALDSIRALFDHLREHEGRQLTLAGHTDATGSESSNENLSHRRAESVQRYLEGDISGWSTLSEAHQTVADWQCVLTWASEVLGWDCHPGPTDNDLGSATAGALEVFRQQCNETFGMQLPLTGPFTAEDWQGAFHCYDLYLSEELGVSPQEMVGLRDLVSFSELAIIACGEMFPAPDQNMGELRDRRVDLVLSADDRRPDFAATPSGFSIYGAACERTYLPVGPREIEPLGRVFFQLLTEMGLDPVPDFEFTLSIGDRKIPGKTDQHGVFDGGIILMSRYEVLIGDGSILAPAIELDEEDPYPLYFFPELTEEARLATGESTEDELRFDRHDGDG